MGVRPESVLLMIVASWSAALGLLVSKRVFLRIGAEKADVPVGGSLAGTEGSVWLVVPQGLDSFQRYTDRAFIPFQIHVGNFDNFLVRLALLDKQPAS